VPVKRRVHKARPSIAAALPLFQHALKARAKWRRSGSAEDFEIATEAEKSVDRALFGPQRLWGVSIFDFDDIYRDRTRPPEDPKWHDAWARALELREALEAADLEQRRARRQASPPVEQQPSEPSPSVA
jgi:hypothetical protein